MPLIDRQNFDRAMKSIITILLLVGYFIALGRLLYVEAYSQLVAMMIGALVGSLTTVIAYHFKEKT